MEGTVARKRAETLVLSRGDRVTWESQANGTRTRKTGWVAAVIPPDTPAATIMDRSAELCDLYRFDRSAVGHVITRSHYSYLVAVETLTPTGRIRNRIKLYWPRVDALTLVPGAPNKKGPLYA